MELTNTLPDNHDITMEDRIRLDTLAKIADEINEQKNRLFEEVKAETGMDIHAFGEPSLEFPKGRAYAMVDIHSNLLEKIIKILETYTKD